MRVQNINNGTNVCTNLLVPSRQYSEALKNYKNVTQQVKSLNTFIKCLDNIMNRRLYVYAELRRQVFKNWRTKNTLDVSCDFPVSSTLFPASVTRFLSARCKYYFDNMLNQRGYTGSMTFDHKNETLSITVRK